MARSLLLANMLQLHNVDASISIVYVVISILFKVLNISQFKSEADFRS